MAVRKHENAVKISKTTKEKSVENYKQYIVICAVAMLINYIIIALLSPQCNQANFHKNAKSAIQRAKSPQCKQKLKEMACLGDAAYPSSIQPTCNFYNQENYLGCFQDAHPNRHLNGSYIKLTNVMNPFECVTFCRGLGFALAGVESGIDCFCGNDLQVNMRIDAMLPVLGIALKSVAVLWL